MREHEMWRLKLGFLHLNIYTLLHKESKSSGFSKSIPHRISPLFSVQPPVATEIPEFSDGKRIAHITGFVCDL